MKTALLLLLTLLVARADAQWELVTGIDTFKVKHLFADGSTVYALIHYDGLLRSDDQGITWIRPNPNPIFEHWITCFVKVDSVLYAATQYDSVLYQSINKGTTWSALRTPVTGPAMGIGVHKKKIFLSAWDSVYRSDDFGATWVTASQNVNPGHQYASIGNNVFTLSSEAGVFRSTNNGDMWYWLPIAGPNGVYGTALIAVGTKLLMGIGGKGIWRTTNLGQTWAQQDAFHNETITAFAVHQNKLFASQRGLAGVTMSSDTGVTWTPINQGLSGADATHMVCTDKYLFVWLDQGGLWRRPLTDLLAVEESEERSGFVLYPNPSTSTCTIHYTLETSSPVEIVILDMLGRSVLNLKEHGQQGTYAKEIDTRPLQEGSYIVSIAAEGKRTFRTLHICR